MKLIEIQTALQKILIEYGPKLLGAIAVWIIGSYAIKFICKLVNKMMDSRDVDPSLKPFLSSIVCITLRILLAITALGMLGIEMTSFIAILGAAGLAIGLALSGTLQNFAGGVMILLFKPFKVGDLIQTDSYMGKVESITIFNTYLLTLDNVTVFIPNGGLSTSALKNYTTNPKRRVDWIIGIGYGDDADKARDVIKKLVEADTRVHKEPEVFIALKELGDSSVNFTVRAWVDSPDYWEVFFRLNEEVYKAFPKEGLNIPFPQLDVHVHKT